MRPARNHTIFWLSLLTLVLSSSSMAAQWVKVTSFPTIFYNEVYFATAQLGFITSFSGTIYRTTNGGDSWATVTLPDANVSSNRDISFPTSTTGFISGEDGIWKSVNGGATWTEITPTGATGVSSSSCWFRTASIGVWGYGSCNDTVVTFWRTSDGGTTWASVRDTSTADVAVGGITYQSGKFFAAGGSGKFWSSTDDGATWTLTNSGSGGWQEDLIEQNGQLLIASANGTSCGSTGGGKILRSNDQGANWTITPYANVVTWGVSMYSATNGIAVGDRGEAFRTQDGGLTWAAHNCGLDPTARLDDVAMVSATNGFAVGDGVFRYRPDTFALQPDTLHFGDVVVGGTSPALDAVVRSLGTAGNVTLRQIGGADGPSFSSPVNLANLQSIPICQNGVTPLRFRPVRSGLHTATFTVSISGQTAPLTIVLRGNGVRPRLNVDPTHEFDTILCERVVEDSIVVRNFGNYPLIIDSIGIVNDAGTFTHLSPALPITILPLTNRTIRFRATTSGFGRMSARVFLYSNDPDFSDSSTMVRLSLYKRPSTLGQLPDTLLIPPAPVGVESDLCVTVANQTEQRISVTRLAPIVDEPAISSTIEGELPVVPTDSLMFCFSAIASDTIPRYETYILVTEPCNNQRTVTLCYQARLPRLSIPSDFEVSGPCGREIADSIVVRNLSDELVRIDSVKSLSPDLLLDFSDYPQSVLPTSAWSIPFSIPYRNVRQSSHQLIVFHAAGSDTVDVTSRWNGAMLFVETSMDTVKACVGDAVRVSLMVENIGDVVGDFLLEKGEPATLPFELSTSSVSVATGDTAVASFTLLGLPVGTHSVLLTFDRGCQEQDSIVVPVIVCRSPLRSLQRRIDLGTIPIGETRTASIVIVNDGTGRIDSITGSSELPLTTTLSSGTSIGTADSARLIATVTADSTGEFRRVVVVDGIGLCVEPDTVLVLWRTPSELPTISGLIEVRSEGCDSTRLDVRTLFASGTDPTTVDTLYLTSGDRYSIDADLYTGVTLPPGASLDLELLAQFDGSAESVDTLVVIIAGDTLRTPLRTIWLRPEIVIRDRDGAPLDHLELTTLRGCPIDTLSFEVANVGDGPDTISLNYDPSELELPGSLQRELAPGGQETIKVIPRPGVENAELILSSLQCGVLDTLTVVQNIIDTPFNASDTIDLGEFCTDSSIAGRVRVPLSTGVMSVAFDRVELVLSDGELIPTSFEINPSMGELTVEFVVPEGADAVSLRFELTDPCTLRYEIPLRYRFVDCRLPLIVLSAPSVLGSWGEVVQMPILLESERGDAIDSVRIGMRVDPLFLQVQELVATRDWSLRIETFNPVTGYLVAMLTTTESAGEARDTIAHLTSTILRGPTAYSAVRFDTTVQNGHLLISYRDGSIGLHDYCDAAGRLLGVRGTFAIRSVHPNPSDGPLLLVYEVPLRADHDIRLTDVTGRVVSSTILKEMPPGERSQLLEVDTLPAGVYSLSVRAGRHQMVRLVVVL